MSDLFPRKATRGWAILGIYIFLYDIIAILLDEVEKKNGGERHYETLSEGCWKALEHPKKRWPIWLAIVILAKHLGAPKFLQRYDPINLISLLVRLTRKALSDGR